MCKINFKMPVFPEGITDAERRSIMFEALSALDLHHWSRSVKILRIFLGKLLLSFEADLPFGNLSCHKESSEWFTLLYRFECRYICVYRSGNRRYYDRMFLASYG